MYNCDFVTKNFTKNNAKYPTSLLVLFFMSYLPQPQISQLEFEMQVEINKLNVFSIPHS